MHSEPLQPIGAPSRAKCMTPSSFPAQHAITRQRSRSRTRVSIETEGRGRLNRKLTGNSYIYGNCCQTDNHTAGVHVIRNDDITNGVSERSEVFEYVPSVPEWMN